MWFWLKSDSIEMRAAGHSLMLINAELYTHTHTVCIMYRASCVVYFCVEKVQFQSNSNEPTASF